MGARNTTVSRSSPSGLPCRNPMSNRVVPNEHSPQCAYTRLLAHERTSRHPILQTHSSNPSYPHKQSTLPILQTNHTQPSQPLPKPISHNPQCSAERSVIQCHICAFPRTHACIRACVCFRRFWCRWCPARLGVSSDFCAAGEVVVCV